MKRPIGRVTVRWAGARRCTGNDGKPESKLNIALNYAVQAGQAKGLWGANLPASFKWPLRDGDAEYLEKGEEYKGHWFLNASSTRKVKRVITELFAFAIDLYLFLFLNSGQYRASIYEKAHRPSHCADPLGTCAAVVIGCIWLYWNVADVKTAVLKGPWNPTGD